MTARRRLRCPWPGDDALYQRYHDREWGVPVRRDRKLYEFLVLEGAQAGLSWLTILRKRANYRRALDNFDFRRVAGYGEREIKQLLKDPGIVRNRLKLRSAVNNARALLEVRREYRSFSAYLWGFVDGEPLQNAWRYLAEVPTRTELSDRISRDLKQRGFSFVGSTIIYAYMQAIGMVNDHLVDCFRHAELQRPNRR